MAQEGVRSPARTRRGQGGGVLAEGNGVAGGGSSSSERMEDRLEDLKKRFHLLEGDRKAYYETTQYSLSTNKERITALRSENKQLYQQLTHLQRVVMAHLEGNNEAERMAYQLREMRKKYDEVKAKVDEKNQNLNRLKDTLRALMMETPTQTEGDQQLATTVRALEQKIEKASLKHTEALTVKRTYEQILNHLQEDRIGYDSHVDSLELGVQAKDKELTELTTLYQDALRSKDFARDELTKTETIANEDKRRRDQILDDKKQRIKQLMDANARMERKVKREEQRLAELRLRAKPPTPTQERDPDYYNQRLGSLTAAYQRLSSMAGVGNHFSDISVLDMDVDAPSSLSSDILINASSPDYDTIAQYLSTQSDIARTLEAHQAKATSRLEALKQERAALAETVASLRLRQLVPTGTRKQVDSYEGRLAQANAAYVRARLKYERAAKANSAIVAGISSLASKLQFVVPEEAFSPITDQNLPEIIQLCKKKIDHIISTKPAIPTSSSLNSMTPGGVPLTPFPPQFTIRIKQPNLALQMPLMEDLDPDESQVPTRDSVKSFSAALVERELKKTKRKQKKHGDKRTPPPTSRAHHSSPGNFSPSPTSTARNNTTARGSSPVPLSARPVK